NTQAAWEFVKYINSDPFAKITSRSGVLSGLPVRTEYIRNDEDIHIEAFYTHSPEPSIKTHYLEELRTLPQPFAMALLESLATHWEALVNEQATPEEALRSIELESQLALDAYTE